MPAFSVLYENEEILLINKPCGTAVQGGEGVAHPLDEELSKQLGYKVHLVHRLDKDTAGILIVAKSAPAASRWTKIIASSAVQKEYCAICTGRPVINGKPADKGCLKGTVEAHGRTQTAETFFTVEKSVSVSIPSVENESEMEKVTLCLLKIKLGTGRMHQIRIQMAKAGAPLAGDDQHGNFKVNKKLRKLGIKKLCLCSYRLTLPLEGKNMVFEIPLPDHMEKVIQNYMN